MASKVEGSGLWLPDSVKKESLPSSTKPFAELMNRPDDLRRFYAVVQASILKSFQEDAERDKKVPNMSGNELKHRFKICETFFRRCRCDHGLSVEKTLDYMHKALRSKLDGGDFDPMETGQTKLWTPG